MTKGQEKLLTHYFSLAFTKWDVLSERQVAYILNLVAWNEKIDDELFFSKLQEKKEKIK